MITPFFSMEPAVFFIQAARDFLFPFLERASSLSIPSLVQWKELYGKICLVIFYNIFVIFS